MNMEVILFVALLVVVALLFNRWLRRRAEIRDVGMPTGGFGANAESAPMSDLPSDVMLQVQDLLARKDKITAIKLVRERTGWGLKESKDYVDRLDR